MKKTITGVAIALGLAVGVASAATLNSSQIGSSCEGGGDWHFVNNRTGGATTGTFTAVIGGETYILGPSDVNANMMHFWIYGAAGTLTSASTNLPGGLQLSQLICEKKEDTPK